MKKKIEYIKSLNQPKQYEQEIIDSYEVVEEEEKKPKKMINRKKNLYFIIKMKKIKILKKE